jgi:hypothetical protein
MEERKPYDAPAVEEVGTFAELTEGGGGVFFDLFSLSFYPLIV